MNIALICAILAHNILLKLPSLKTIKVFFKFFCSVTLFVRLYWQMFILHGSLFHLGILYDHVDIQNIHVDIQLTLINAI